MIHNHFAATSAGGSLSKRKNAVPTMKWLNENAAAIQVLSGIAVLVVTGLLAWLTSRYVRLTREIANSSLEQVKLSTTQAP